MNFTDLFTVMTYLTIGGNNLPTNSPSILSTLIAQESQRFLDETRRDFLESQSVTEIKNGTGSQAIQLVNDPVTAVAALTVWNCNVPAYTASPATRKGYVFTANGQIQLAGWPWRFERGLKNISVTYTAGYLPITVTQELQTIPASGQVPQPPYNIQLFNPNFRRDLGVTYFVGGAPLTYVNGSPSTGQYYVVPVGQPYAGQYQFNVGDQGKAVQISYTYSGIPASIVECVTEMVSLRYKARNHLDKRGDNLGNGVGTTYVGTAFTDSINRTINLYRRVVQKAVFGA